MIVRNPADREIIGGYRFILGEDIEIVNGVPRIATSHMFRFSERFISEFLPETIELGRSFVAPEYQTTKAGAKALYALDNLGRSRRADGDISADQVSFRQSDNVSAI